MARTLILNVSAEVQVLPALYGSFPVLVGHGRVVSDESSVVVDGLGGFAAMDGKWAVSAISTDTALGDYSLSENGLAMLATFVPGGGGGSSGPAAWADITGKPSFAPVATSGSYNDLTDKPVLADVAVSGSYADLSGTPTLPSASNTTPADVAATAAAGVQAGFARADHQHAHGNLAGGTLHNAATSLAAGFMSAADKSKLDGLANVATSGAYADLTGKPSLFSGAYADLTGKPGTATTSTDGLMSAADKTSLDNLASTTQTLSTAFSSQVISKVGETGDYNDLINKPALKPVATTGAYADLTGKPTLAAVATSGAYGDLSARTYDIGSYAAGMQGVGTVIAQVLAPRNLTLNSLQQTGGATVKVQVAGVDVTTYPKAVTSGQLISVVVSVAGNGVTFMVAGVEA